MELFTSVYLKRPIVFSGAEQVEIEKLIGAEVSEVDSRCMNIYSVDEEVIAEFCRLIGPYNVAEYSKGEREEA